MSAVCVLCIELCNGRFNGVAVRPVLSATTLAPPSFLASPPPSFLYFTPSLLRNFLAFLLPCKF